jgi:succinate-semialdehyde dehydrogenase / glutarate-semialdehyde dehydrogenase
VRKLTFTGSTEIGKLLMRAVRRHGEEVSLELGGNAPFIVFDDADLDAAVAGAIASKFRNTGQTCVCANRMLVQDGVYDAFAAKLAAAVAGSRSARLRGGRHDQGPLIDERRSRRSRNTSPTRVAQGARIVPGGRRHALGGTFFEPTVLTGVTPDMVMAREETFGPVAPLFRFKTEAEAIALANDTEFGLAAYFYTATSAASGASPRRSSTAWSASTPALISTEVAPFGGVKESGIGREGSPVARIPSTARR